MDSLFTDPFAAQPPAVGVLPRWDRVDTVLLDMDGTLLDLRFDNYFWLELVPQRYAQRHGLTLQEAQAALAPLFVRTQGTLQWYCTDFWSRELALDIASLKHEIREHVRFLPGAEHFLRELRGRGLRTVLVTNAHRDSLAVKAAQTGLDRHFQSTVTSHDFGVPKEHPQFWQALQGRLDYEPSRCLFVDDSLAVLRAARSHGIGQVFAISRPDSTQAVRVIEEFAAVEDVKSLLGSLEEIAD